MKHCLKVATHIETGVQAKTQRCCPEHVNCLGESRTSCECFIMFDSTCCDKQEQREWYASNAEGKVF